MPGRASCGALASGPRRSGRPMSHGGAVGREQVRTLYDQSRPVLAANVLNALVVSATLWTAGPRALLVGWCALMLLMALARLELRRHFRRARPDVADTPRWARY